MTDKPFKALERACAALLGGTRFPANSGGPVDIEGPAWLAQVKLRRNLSLEDLTQLVETITQEATTRGKFGCVMAKVRRGKGKESPVLVVMDAETWRKGHVPAPTP